MVRQTDQAALRAGIDELVSGDDRTAEGGRRPHDVRTARRADKGHGRREVRRITASAELTGYSDWPGLAQVFRLERQRRAVAGGKEQREAVYGLTSLAPAGASPARLLTLTRACWGVENGLHDRRDVTFREDAARLTRGCAGHVMASLNNPVISLLRRAGFTNLAAARHYHGAGLANVLTLLSPALRT